MKTCTDLSKIQAGINDFYVKKSDANRNLLKTNKANRKELTPSETYGRN